MYMDDQNCSFDTTNNPEAAAAAAALPEFHLGHVGEEQHVPYAAAAAAAAMLEIELQQQHFGNSDTVLFSSNNNNNSNNSWQYHQQQVDSGQHHDLLNLFHFSSPPPPSSVAVAAAFDPLLHLNLPAPHPPPLFHYTGGGGFLSSASRAEGLYMEVDPAELESGGGGGGGGVLLEFGRERGVGRGTKHFASERHRRDQMRDTYSMLRSLVPNPTKNDRASVVGDAIEYIKELRRTVNELKILVEQKRRGRDHNKRQKSDDDDSTTAAAAAADPTSGDVKPEPDHFSHIRSSWLRRKSKDTEVDVRIVDDDVTVKLVQRKKINLLLTASRVLDELQLDLRHVAGGHVGDTYSYLFNTKICEGSSLYASAIANKLIDVLDRQYATVTY